MYAIELMDWLHQRLGEVEGYEQSVARFEQLRGYNLLPRGRENAGVRLSNNQIASAILGFCHPKAGFAGHGALIWGDLRRVGGSNEPFEDCQNLNAVISKLINSFDASEKLIRLTLSIARDFNSDGFKARLYHKVSDKDLCISFVSKYATSLLNEGKEIGFEHEKMGHLSAWERSLGPEFFKSLSRSVKASRQFDRPLKTDWQEYKNEEERAEFNRNLGALNSSDFLNLRVEANVTWPKEPVRIKFARRHFVLFPQTKENSRSISIDLNAERIRAEEARTLINRLLSLLSWCDNQAASVHEGFSGSKNPAPMLKKNLGGTSMNRWYFGRTLPTDEQLLRCLAYYRDGLIAEDVGLASHAVLSFYRVFETKYETKKPVIAWVDNLFSDKKIDTSGSEFKYYEDDQVVAGKSHGEYIYENCRVAVAHGAKDFVSDPDQSSETARLFNAASIVQQIARHFILEELSFSDSFLSDISQ